VSILAQSPNHYQQRAHATRAARQAAGRYPTRAHKAAFAKMIQRGGLRSLTADECEILATHPQLTFSQRATMVEMAAERRTESDVR
jgi:hypothetical protein